MRIAMFAQQRPAACELFRLPYVTLQIALSRSPRVKAAAYACRFLHPQIYLPDAYEYVRETSLEEQITDHVSVTIGH